MSNVTRIFKRETYAEICALRESLAPIIKKWESKYGYKALSSINFSDKSASMTFNIAMSPPVISTDPINS